MDEVYPQDPGDKLKIEYTTLGGGTVVSSSVFGNFECAVPRVGEDVEWSPYRDAATVVSVTHKICDNRIQIELGLTDLLYNRYY